MPGHGARMIAVLRELANPGKCEVALWARMRVHRLASAAIADLGYYSKLTAKWDFLIFLRDEGRQAAEEFLQRHGHHLGRRSPLDLEGMLRD